MAVRLSAGAVAFFAASCLTCAAARDPAAAIIPVKVLVGSQGTARDLLAVERLRSAARAAGWGPGSVVSRESQSAEAGHGGLWTYRPWLWRLALERRQPGATKWMWYVFVEAITQVLPDTLQAALAEHPNGGHREVFLGRALVDDEVSILHHYSSGEVYPHADAGFALSGALVERLADELRDRPLGHDQQIEPAWELSSWVRSSANVSLSDRSDLFCARRAASCVAWALPQQATPSTAAANAGDVVIGVKTVGGFHSSRLPLVWEFWARSSPTEVLFLSNQSYGGPPGVQIVDLSPEFGDMVDPMKESTKQGSGHCSKMKAMLTYLSRHWPGRKWYVLTDDDTLLNVPRLLELLGEHGAAEPLAVGERYGWGHRERNPGTNYITTGGGLALNGLALDELVRCSRCQCTSPNAPDDMSLGSWMEFAGVQIVHESGFHQAEPSHYHPEVLASSREPVSFHRFALHLPADATAAEKHAARRESWSSWVSRHFRKRPARGPTAGASSEL